MAEPATNIIEQEKFKKKLLSIYNDLKAGMTCKDAKEIYGIRVNEASDIKSMSREELDDIIKKIPSIRERIQAGKETSKISIECDCTEDIIRFIGRQTCTNYKTNYNTKIGNRNMKHYKKTEEMWKKYTSGVSIEDLSVLYNDGSIDGTRFILNNFQKLLNSEITKDTVDIEQRRKTLSSKYGFDSDTIDYIINRKKQPEIISIEECKEKLTKLYEDITIEARPLEDLKTDYQVTPYIVSELRRMPKEKFDKFLEEIPYIEYRVKQGLQDKNIKSKIGMEIGIAGKLVTYVAKNISEEFANRKIKGNTSKKLQEKEGVSLDEP